MLRNILGKFVPPAKPKFIGFDGFRDYQSYYFAISAAYDRYDIINPSYNFTPAHKKDLRFEEKFGKYAMIALLIRLVVKKQASPPDSYGDKEKAALEQLKARLNVHLALTKEDMEDDPAFESVAEWAAQTVSHRLKYMSLIPYSMQITEAVEYMAFWG